MVGAIAAVTSSGDERGALETDHTGECNAYHIQDGSDRPVIPIIRAEKVAQAQVVRRCGQFASHC